MITRFNDPKSFISSSFDEPVLYMPARFEAWPGASPCTNLKIITAFTDCERISTHMIALKEGMINQRFAKGISVEIILGMTKTSLSSKKHEDICRLIRFLNGDRNMPRVTCRYISSGKEVHSKVYIWSREDNTGTPSPTISYCGSLNYTMNAFYKRRESVSICNNIGALRYYQDDLLPDTVDCFDPSVSDKLKNVINSGLDAAEEPDNSELDYLHYDQQQPVAECTVSLLFADGSGVGIGSGVNWGIRPNGYKRDPNQAYFPYNVKDRISGFFPQKINETDKNYPMFRVITKDFGSFHMRIAQQGGKALQSVESNAILGEWLRKRLNIPSGGLIAKHMLDNYGKTYVTFRKYMDEDDQPVYLLDF